MNTSFGNIGNIEGACENYFGAEIKSNTCYYDPLGTATQNNVISTDRKLAEVKSKVSNASKFVYDARAELNYNYHKRSAQLKALTSTTGGSGTTDNVLQPLALDPEMWDLSRKELPARTLIRRVTNVGAKAVWNTLDSKQGGEFYAELQPNTYNDLTPSRHSTDIKMLRSAGVTSYFANATQPNFTINGFNYQANVDGSVGTYTSQNTSGAIDMNVVTATKSLMEFEENKIFNGDSSVDSKEFDGIIKIMGTTNTLDKNSTALTLADYRTAYRYARQDGGYPDLAFTDLVTYDETIGLILATKNGIVDYGDETEYGFSYVKLRVTGSVIKLIGSQFMTVTDGSRAVYLMDSRTWEMRVVQDITYLPMGRTFDGESFIVKMYEALICKAVQFNSSITEISA